jgi:hypothetical protein
MEGKTHGVDHNCGRHHNGRNSPVRLKDMGLAENLSDVALAFECPNCSHPAVRKGSALRTIAHIRCDGCDAKVRITYPQKLAIFEKHKMETAQGALQSVL